MSARKRAETEGAKDSRRSNKPSASGGGNGRGGGGGGGRGGGRKGKTELGRALRSIYDDTLREPVPDDILGLIGKLS